LLLFLLLLVSGCGSKSAHHAHKTAAATPTVKLDGDGDPDETLGVNTDGNDDGPVEGFPTAKAADWHAIATLVRRYYAAAATRDGTVACSLLYFILAESVVEDYAHPPGPLYLRGAPSCQAVLARVFNRFHAELSQPPRVTAVGVQGMLAHAIVEWSGLPTGMMEAKREGRVWKIDSVLAAPLR
jgi:hypothetical protein